MMRSTGAAMAAIEKRVKKEQAPAKQAKTTARAVHPEAGSH